MAKLDDILSQANKGGPVDSGKGGKEGIVLGGKDILRYTKNVNELGKAWKKAIRTQDVKTLNLLNKEFTRLKEIEKGRKKIAELKAELTKWSEVANDSKVSAEKLVEAMEKIKTISTDLEEATKQTGELEHAFQAANRSLMGKGWDNLKEMALSKWTGFASLATAAGLAGKTVMSFDKAANMAANSLELMPVSQTADDFRQVQKELGTTSEKFKEGGEEAGLFSTYVGGTSKALGSSIDRLREANAVHNKYSKTIDNAVLMTQNLREISIRTGKDMSEVTETYNAVQQTFRLSLDKDMKKLTDTTLAAEQFGKVLGIGSAEAVEKFRMRTQDMGTSVETAELEMAGMVNTADTLRKSNKDLSMSNKQYADLVYDSVSADTRSTQNLRLKNQIIQNTIDLMLKQGRTQKEAMEAGKNAAAAATKGSHAVEVMTGMELAKTLQASSAKIKALEDEGKADEAAAAQKELMGKLTAGMSPEEKAKAEIRLGGMVEAAKKGELKDTFSLGERLNNLLGSQQAGMIERRKKQYALYADKEQSTMVRLLQTQEGMTADVAEETAAAFKKAHDEGNESYLDNLKIRANAEEKTQKDIATATDSKSKQGGLAGQLYDQGKKLLDNPLVTGLGAVAATAAYAAHTAAMFMHAKALAGGSVPGVGMAKGLMSGAGGIGKAAFKNLGGKFAIGSGVGAAAFEGVSSIMDYQNAKASGASDDELATVRNKGIGKTAGAGLGAWGGAAAGAAVGSVVPVIGTVIGGLIGAAIGGWLGTKGGEMVADAVTAPGVKIPGQIAPDTSGAKAPPNLGLVPGAGGGQTGPGGTIAPRYDGTEPNGGLRFILDPAGAAAVQRAASGGFNR